jgi:hypothetical protein
MQPVCKSHSEAASFYLPELKTLFPLSVSVLKLHLSCVGCNRSFRSVAVSFNLEDGVSGASPQRLERAREGAPRVD